MTDSATPAPVPAVELSDKAMADFFSSKGEVSPTAETLAPDADTPEPTPAPVEEPETAPPAAAEKKEEEKFVKLGALHEERNKRKALEAEQKELRAKFARMEEIFQERVQRAQEAEAQQDPTQYLRSNQQQLAQQVARIEQEKQQQQQQELLVRHYRSHAQHFAKETPDFNEAYAFLISNRIAEYEAVGYTPAEAELMTQQDELAIAAKAFHDEVNPGERLYKAAQLRGYKKADKAPEKPGLAQLEKGMAASKTLATTAGKKTVTRTLESLAEIKDPDEFEKAWAEFSKTQGGSVFR